MKKLALLLISVCFFGFTLGVEARSAADVRRAEEFSRYYGVLPDEVVQKRIKDLGQKLVDANRLNPADFSFGVINSNEINAVTLPGGYIYLFKGLVDFMPTDAELAVVIGHEMGHVTGNHIARREREQIFSTILGALLGGPQGAMAMNAALASLPAYNQRDEREADDSSFKYVLGAGMNPYALLVVMNKLSDAETAGIESNFAQHPQPAARAGRIQKYIQQRGIAPVVTDEGSQVRVTDGGWSFSVSQPDGANKPLYRAWLLAGALYCIAEAGLPDQDKFIVVEQPRSADIYYEGRFIYTVGEMDALTADGATAASQAAAYVEQLRGWAKRKIGSNDRGGAKVNG